MGLLDFFGGDDTPGYELIEASDWQRIAGEDGFENAQAFRRQYLLNGEISRGFVKGGRGQNQAQRAKLGAPVKKPNKKAGTLFTADSNNLPGRHDCVTVGGTTYCVYTKDEYDGLRETLQARAKADAKAAKEGKVYNANLGSHITKEREKSYKDATIKRVKASRENFDRKNNIVRAEPDPSPKYPVQLRIRDAQQVLLNYMHDIITFNNRSSGGNSSFANIIGYKGDPGSFFNILTSAAKGQASPFVRATPAQLGALVPKVEFFEVTANPGHKDPKKKEVVTPIYFPNYSSGKAAVLLGKAKAAATGRDSAADILSARGTVGTDVGVTEFHWVYDNKDIGQNVLKADLTLHFGSAADVINPEYRKFMFMNGQGPQPNSHLVGSPPPEDEENKNLTPGERMVRMESQIRDRIANIAKGHFEENSTNELKDKNLSYQTLRVMCGWARPEGNTLPVGLNDDFLSALSATTRIIDLNLLSYKLNFQQEGQVSLQLSYAGSIGVLLSDGGRSDVLRTVEAGKSAAKVEVPVNLYLLNPNEEKDGSANHSLASSRRSWAKGYIYKKARKGKLPLNVNQYAKRFTDPSTPPNIPTISVSLEGVQYELNTLIQLKTLENAKRQDSKKEPTPSEKEATAKLDRWTRTAQMVKEEIQAATRKARYSGFLDRIFHNKKLRVATLRTGYPSKTASSPTGRLNMGANPEQLYRFFPYDHTHDADAEIKNRMITAADAANSKESGDIAKTAPSLGHLNPDAVIDAGSISKLTRWDEVKLYYMRLGDILEAAMQAGITRDDYGVVLGSINPGQVGASASAKHPYYTIADIPISIEYFGQWFMTEIVSKEATQMSFRSFAMSILKDLVEPAIAARAKPGDRTLSNLRFTMTVARLYKSLTPGYTYTEVELAAAAARPTYLMPSKPAHQYLLIGVDEYARSMKGNRAQDEANGIYHLLLGADQGLVKSWSFSEKKIPYLRAMNISNANYGRALVLPQDVTLTMVGNTLFQNGQMIYINADMGLGTAVARELNLGGYYRVVKSENTITPQKYETSLTCMWEASPWLPEG